MAGGLASPPESRYNSPLIPVASSSSSTMPFEKITPLKFVNPRDLHDPTDSDGESVERVRLTEKGVKELGDIEPNLNSSANARRLSACSSLTNISQESPMAVDEPTTAVECPVEPEQPLLDGEGDGVFVRPTEISSDLQIDGQDDPMVGLHARVQLDSQENGEDDPAVRLELKVVSSDPQKGGEGDPMHGGDLEVQTSKERPSKHVTKELSQMHSVELADPSSKEQPLTTQNSATKESTQMSVDSELANKLAAFDLRRSSRNSAKEKSSQKVTNPPKLSNVKRKSVIKKDGILSLVSVWNNLLPHKLTANFQDDFEDGSRKLSDVGLATVGTFLFRRVNASQHLKIVSPNALCQHCRVGINCGGWPQIISTCARSDCATWKCCVGRLKFVFFSLIMVSILKRQEMTPTH